MRIAGCILAGGAGRRVGGQDKGLLPWRGQPLLSHVLTRFAPQVQCLCLSANGHVSHYQWLGLPVLPDLDIPGDRSDSPRQGPLAGIERGLHFARQQHCALLAIVPCDAPVLPTTLVPRLQQALQKQAADLAIARVQGRDQPLFCLLRTELHQDLLDHLRSQERKVLHWLERFSIARVCFDEEAAAFTNINTLQQLRISENTPEWPGAPTGVEITQRINGQAP